MRLLATIPFLLLLPSPALSAALVGPGPAAAAAAARRDVSPDKTCGLAGAGANRGYTCPGDAACCSRHGYCGTGDAFCLTTAGCQARYSNSTSAACYASRSGVTVSPDGTCGTAGAGTSGYRCPAAGLSCCSAA